jgi:molybdate transport system substrate-binding protein
MRDLRAIESGHGETVVSSNQDCWFKSPNRLAGPGSKEPAVRLSQSERISASAPESAQTQCDGVHAETSGTVIASSQMFDQCTRFVLTAFTPDADSPESGKWKNGNNASSYLQRGDFSMTSQIGGTSGGDRLEFRSRSKWFRLGMALLVSQMTTPPAHAADIMVAAAASLTDAFTEIGVAYEKATPNTHVLFNFAPSGELLKQLSNGASEDVFASADPVIMDAVEKQRLILRSSRANFAGNKLLLVVSIDSKLEISELGDLARPRVRTVALGTPETVPAGRYARGTLEREGLWGVLSPKLVFTQTARQGLYQVARGEADAGLVYATDAANSHVKIRTVLEVPVENPIVYSIGALSGSGNESRALGFIAFVRSEAGQVILAKHGFLRL